MLLSEDPAALIAHTINNFNINPDKVAVARIGESISTLQQARELRIKGSVAALKKLSRVFNALQSQHEDLAATHSAAAHAAEIAQLDTQKFRLAKAAADADAEVGRLAQQAADLEARLQELEAQGVEGGPEAGAAPGAGTAAEDEVLLRLKVYRSLGIQIERGADDHDQDGVPAAAGFTKAVIRNDRLGDVHVVNLDKKFSPFFYANFFWQTV